MRPTAYNPTGGPPAARAVPAARRAVRRRPARGRRVSMAATLGLLVVMSGAYGCTPPGIEDTAVSRGDVAFARDSLDEALAEYRLAVRQGGDDPTTLARVAHTFARMARVDEAQSYYRQAVARDSSLADQAAADFVHMAEEASEHRDRFLMASALEAGLEFRPGLGLEEMALPLARHYFESGEYGRALPFYEKALDLSSDSAPDVVFEVGQAHEEIGDCERALVYFERFRGMTRPWDRERGEVDWYIGTCSFRVAQEKHQDAQDLERRLRGSAEERGARKVELLETALRNANRTLQVEEPRNLQGQALFLKGEILSKLGLCDAAMQAFEKVRWAEPSPNTTLARRAQERFDRIRFGRGTAELTGGSGCEGGR